MKKINVLTFGLVFVSLLCVTTTNSFAQMKKIAVVNIMDTTLLHIHLGTTIFSNKIDTFSCQFNCKNYVEQQLLYFMSKNYTVNEISIPDSVLSKKRSIYDFFGVKKSVKSWVMSLKGKYDIVIYVESSKNITTGYPSEKPLISSGLFSQGNVIKSWASAFSTISLTAFKTPDASVIECAGYYVDRFKKIKEYKFSQDKISIDPEMMPVVRAELIARLDKEIERFLTISSLLPRETFNNLKSTKSE